MRWSMVGLLVLAACGSPTTPEGFPELTGEYVATRRYVSGDGR